MSTMREMVPAPLQVKDAGHTLLKHCSGLQGYNVLCCKNSCNTNAQNCSSVFFKINL